MKSWDRAATSVSRSILSRNVPQLSHAGLLMPLPTKGTKRPLSYRAHI